MAYGRIVLMQGALARDNYFIASSTAGLWWGYCINGGTTVNWTRVS